MNNNLNELIYFNKRKIFICIIIILALIGGGIYYYLNYFNTDDVEDDGAFKLASEDDNITEEEVVVTDQKDEEQICYFDIKGEIKNPGVYGIDCTKRIVDAIAKSGGITKNGDTSVLNLSKKIEDGMVIVVYSKKEIASYLETLKEEEDKLSVCDDDKINNDACINKGSGSNTSTKININTATLEELMTLSGIGESKAKNIISYREKTPFSKIEDLLNVDGIGESLYATIKENITI